LHVTLLVEFAFEDEIEKQVLHGSFAKYKKVELMYQL